MCRTARLVAGILIWISFSVGGGVSHAATYALLVGVGEYPRLGPDFALTGPENDLRLARDFLSSRDVPEQNITILAGPTLKGAEPPTLANIELSLRALTSKVGQGDTVYLHFSGHGSQQLGDAVGNETDLLDEVFLTRDTGPMTVETGRFTNVLTDDVLATHVRALRNTGAFVWLVFDSCHSGGMARGSGGGTERAVRLALSAQELRVLRRRINRKLQASNEDSPTQVLDPLSPTAGGFAGFFASQDNQLTMERPMVSGDDRTFGVFSYTLFETLNRAQSLSYRDVAHAIVARYGARGDAIVSPKFEGTGLENLVLGDVKRERSREWPITAGVDAGTAILAAGTAHGVGTGDVIGLIDRQGNATTHLGTAVIDEASAFESRLAALETNAPDVLQPANISPELWGRLEQKALSTQTIVALPADAPGPITDVLDTVGQDQAFLDAHGITWGASDGYADIRIFAEEAALSLSSSDAATATSYGLPLSKDSSKTAARLRETLARMVRAKGVMKVAVDAANIPFDRVFKTKVTINPVARASLPADGDRSALNCGTVRRDRAIPFQNGATTLRNCDLLSISLRNRSHDDWDLTILYLGTDFGFSVVFPPPGQSARLHSGDRLKLPPLVAYSDPEANGQETWERLIILAQKARSGFPESDFRFLADQTLAASRSSGTATGFEARLAAAAGSAGSRSAVSVGSDDPSTAQGTATVLRWKFNP